jgi:flagellar hook-basal body complex protein FliE
MVAIGPLPALPSLQGVDAARGATGAASGAAPTADASGASSFTDVLGDALARLNGQLSATDASMAAFASGQSADIGTVMLQMQEASLGLKLGVQVRDRLLDAYREIMRLQV